MTTVFWNVTTLMAFASIGFLLAKLKIANSRYGQILSTLLVYVFSPAFQFQTFAKNFNINYIKGNYEIMLISLIILAVLIVFSLTIPRILTKNTYKRKVYEYSMIIANYGYMGYPLTKILFGDEVLLNVMMFALPFTVYIYGYALSRLTNTGVNLKKLTNHTIVAILLGMIYGLSGLGIPEVFTKFLDTASAPMGITAMLLAGITISEYKFKNLMGSKATYFIVIWRLLILPISLGFVLTKVFNAPDIARVALISSILSIGTIPICLHIFNLV